MFVSSTVYDFESQLDMVYSTLDGYGYDVMMSHKGTIPLDSKLSNLENCHAAIQNNTLPKSRKGNWVQEYRNMQDVMLHVEAQFKDVERIKQLIGSHE